MLTYALSTWLYLSKTVETALIDFKNAGFNHVEIWADKAHLDPRFSPDFESVYSMVKKYQIKVHSIHAPFHGMAIGSDQSDQVKRSECWLLKTLEYASKLSARVMVVHPLTFNFETGSGTLVEMAQELFSRIVSQSENLGVTIAVENMPLAPLLIHQLKDWLNCFLTQK